MQPNSQRCRSCSSHVLENIVAGLAIKWQFSGVDYINIEWIWERNSGLQTQRRPEKTFVLAATRTAIVRALVVFRQRVSSISNMVNVNRRGSLLLQQSASILSFIGAERCRGNHVLSAARAVLYELGVYRMSLVVFRQRTSTASDMADKNRCEPAFASF